MVNMGAIVMCTLINGKTYKEKFERILSLTRALANNPDISLDEYDQPSETMQAHHRFQ